MNGWLRLKVLKVQQGSFKCQHLTFCFCLFYNFFFLFILNLCLSYKNFHLFFYNTPPSTKKTKMIVELTSAPKSTCLEALIPELCRLYVFYVLQNICTFIKNVLTLTLLVRFTFTLFNGTSTPKSRRLNYRNMLFDWKLVH